MACILAILVSSFSGGTAAFHVSYLLARSSYNASHCKKQYVFMAYYALMYQQVFKREATGSSFALVAVVFYVRAKVYLLAAQQFYPSILLYCLHCMTLILLQVGRKG